MDTEFINTFIAKQKALIDDLQSRLLMSETKLTIVEKKLNEANAELEKDKVSKTSKKGE